MIPDRVGLNASRSYRIIPIDKHRGTPSRDLKSGSDAICICNSAWVSICVMTASLTRQTPFTQQTQISYSPSYTS